jgi:hypothetical protein
LMHKGLQTAHTDVVLCPFTYARMYISDYAGAWATHQREEEMARQSGDTKGLAVSLVNQADLAGVKMGDSERGWRFCETRGEKWVRTGFRRWRRRPATLSERFGRSKDKRSSERLRAAEADADGFECVGEDREWKPRR